MHIHNEEFWNHVALFWQACVTASMSASAIFRFWHMKGKDVKNWRRKSKSGKTIMRRIDPKTHIRKKRRFQHFQALLLWKHIIYPLRVLDTVLKQWLNQYSECCSEGALPLALVTVAEETHAPWHWTDQRRAKRNTLPATQILGEGLSRWVFGTQNIHSMHTVHNIQHPWPTPTQTPTPYAPPLNRKKKKKGDLTNLEKLNVMPGIHVLVFLFFSL